MKVILRNSLIVFLLVIGGILLILENQIGGFRAFIVTSASMEPSISTGSFIITKYIHPSLLQKNDTITFIAPTKNREFVTHRIIAASHQPNLSVFHTKGDNNKSEDPWRLAGGAVVGKTILTIPYIGFLFSFFKSQIGILLFILLPCVYIVIDEMHFIITTIKSHKKENNSDQQIAALKS